MKRQAFQKKRRSTGGGLFVFHTKTRRRKKHRVAASAEADLGSEVPNLGVARALFVILILHVAAIAAIFIHNRVTNDDPVVTSTEDQAAAAMVGRGQEKLPVVRHGEDFYFVATGDNYERIARLKGVDVNALRDLNDNVRLKAGRILRIPAAGAGAPERSAASIVMAEPGDTPAAPRVTPAADPAVAPRPIRDPAPVPAGEAPPGPAIMVKRATPAKALRVVVEKPADSAAKKVTPNARLAENTTVTVAAGGQYKVQKGDTAWGIAQRHKVSVDRLLKANGISDARKMRSGMTLKIPTN